MAEYSHHLTRRCSGSDSAAPPVLRARGIAVPDSARERILAQKDPELLESWLEKAVVASSVSAILAEPN